MPYLFRVLLLFFFAIGIQPSQAQEAEEQDQDTTKNFKLSGFPVLFFLPETGLGYGALGVATFRFKDEPYDSRPSSAQLAFSFTTRKQLLIFAPYELYWDNEKWRLFGELGYYKFFYNFFGVGINSVEENFETYDVTFPRLRASLLHEIYPKISVGAGYELDIFSKLSFPEDGILDNSDVLGKDGGGTISNLGFLVVYDSRNDIFQPTSGFFIQSSIFGGAGIFGSSFDYTRTTLDARYYQKVKGAHSLATNFFLSHSSAGTPFLSLNYLGNNKRTRGFDDRRFQDNSELSFAAEYRFPIKGRFGGVAFAATGTVAPDFGALFSTEFRSAAGVGLRYVINKKDGIRLRVDYAISSEGGNFYFTIGESF